MSSSTTHLDQIEVSQSAKEATANGLFGAASPAMLFGRHTTTSEGLNFGLYGGMLDVAGEPQFVANQVLALTASSTNYVSHIAGVVSVVTSAPTDWPGPLASDAIALYAIVTGPDTVTAFTDYRVVGGGGGGGGGGGAETVESIGALINGATAKTTPVDADMLALMDSAASNVVKKLSWANLKATLKTYFDTVYAAVSQPFDLTAFYPGVPTSSAVVIRVPVARAVTFPDDFAGSYGKASVAATAITAFDVQKNGVSVGTISFAAAATTATFVTSGAAVVMAAGDVLSIVAPATADATLANPGFVLAGTR